VSDRDDPVRSASVGVLPAILDGSGLRLASDPAGRDLAISHPYLFDPDSPLTETPGGILLGVGLRAEQESTRVVIRQAAERRFSAIVVKCHGYPVDLLVQDADDAGVALLVVPDDTEWLQLASLLTNAVGTANHIGMSLSSLAVGDLFALANAIAAAVGGATAIEDLSQRVLAYSNLPGQPIDDDRRDGILGRQVPDLSENAEQYHHLYRSQTAVRFEAVLPALPRLAVTVRVGREPLGSIWVVDPGESLSDQAAHALTEAAPVAALHLLRARSATDLARQQRSELVSQLLGQQGDASRAITLLGIDHSGPFTVLAFEPQRGVFEELRALSARLTDVVTLHCEARAGYTGSVAIGGTVYVLLASDQVRRGGGLEQLARDVAASAAATLRVDLCAGIGPAVDSSTQIVASRRDADRVLNLLRRRPDLGQVSSSSELADQLILGDLGLRLSQDPSLVSPRAQRVLAHDEEHDTPYAKVLLTFLDCHRDVSAAAGRLAMHPNTVRYRLRRAVELFDLDLNDPDQTLTFWLALRARFDQSTSATPQVSREAVVTPGASAGTAPSQGRARVPR